MSSLATCVPLDLNSVMPEYMLLLRQPEPTASDVTEEVLGGYFIMEVADYEAALNLANGCPVLALGGSVEIRALEKNYRLDGCFG